MPIIKSAIKRMHQAATRKARNQNTKKDVKSAVKAFIAEPSAKALSAAQSQIDTAVKKNILEKNTAARRKAQLVRVAKTAGVSLTASTKKATTTTAAKPTVKKAAPKAAAKPAVKKAPVKKAAPKKTTK
jgi:ribosomal protein S20